MEKRKGQNSILFVATLGVYLGLVLVGAPHVLAQAATTRPFDVKDEIELKDEFDGSPDIEELKSLITNAVESSIASFIYQIRESDKNSDARASLESDLSFKTLRNYCAEDWVEITDPLKSLQDKNELFVDLHRKLDVGGHWGFSSVPKFIQAQDGPPKQKFCKAFAVTTSLDSKGLSVKLLFSQTDSLKAFRLAGSVNNYIFDRSHGFHDPVIPEVYHFTHVTADYANLVVDTRLPRGSLEGLISNDAK